VNLNTIGPPPASGGGDNPSDGSLVSDLRGSGEGSSGLPDLSGASAPRRRLSMQNMVIVLAVVASAGSLFMMRQQGRKAGLDFSKPLKVSDPQEFAKPYPDQARILRDLARSTQGAATPEKLEKNPFKFDAPVNLPGATSNGVPTVNPEEERVRSILSTLQIGAIMQGPTPVARVNGRIVKVGDTIDGVLMVAQIHDRSVDFIANGATHTVHMGEGTGGGTNPVRRMPAPQSRPPVPYGPPPER
jgi:hypothetical protein